MDWIYLMIADKDWLPVSSSLAVNSKALFKVNGVSNRFSDWSKKQCFDTTYSVFKKYFI